MSEYKVTLARRASKDIEKLPARVIGRVVAKLEELANNPRPPGSKKLQGTRGVWRIRIGDYRVLYEIDDTKKIVDVSGVRHRSQAYE